MGHLQPSCPPPPLRSCYLSNGDPSEPWKHGLPEVLRFTRPVDPYLLVMVLAFAQ